MSFPCRAKYLLACLCVIAPVSALAATPFRICAEPDNLPMSQESTRSGFEVEVAGLLAKELGRPLEITWVAQRDHSYFRQTIGKGACDVIMSVPSGFAILTTTRPWYRTGFYFVARSSQSIPNSFDDEKLRKQIIGVPATGLGETPPALALTQRGLAAQLHPYSIYEPQKMISDVANNTLTMAIAWGPFAGWFAGEATPPLAIAPTPEKDGKLPLAFPISIGVKKGNDALKNALDTALDHQSEAIKAVLKKWRMPESEV